MKNRGKIIKYAFFLLFFMLIPAGQIVSTVSASEISGVSVYPDDHIWNVPVDTLPVHTRSVDYIQKIGNSTYLHADFGSGMWEGYPIGIPYNVVNGSVAKKNVSFEYADESDPGPYPIPEWPLIEGGSDHHVLILDHTNGILYELYAAEKQPDGSWNAGSGAIFNLSDYSLRPAGWTSADAAGLPVLPGLVRYDEVSSGEINHAIRFTAPSTQRAYVWPGRHYASSITDTAYPPMGQRFRLKSSFNTTGYSYQARVVLNALKKYGMILADNGAPWYISGVPDENWDNDILHTLHQLKGSDFEAVDSTSLMIDPDSGRARRTDPDTIGIYKEGNWYIDCNADGRFSTTAGDKYIPYGASGWTQLVGDWNGDGASEIGIYKDGLWYIDYGGSGVIDANTRYYSFGGAGWTPLIGDWNADKKDEIGVYQNGNWYLDNTGNGVWGTGDLNYGFGTAGWIPVVGKWTAGDISKIGIYHAGNWYIDYNGDGQFIPVTGDKYIPYGATGWTQLVGDWNGDGKSEIGIYKDGLWYIDYGGSGVIDANTRYYSFGGAGWIPIIGDWNADTRDEIGVYNAGNWYLDYDGTGVWSAGDRNYGFGTTGWTPVIGKWN
jgi:hypothetical protein